MLHDKIIAILNRIHERAKIDDYRFSNCKCVI